MRAWPPLEIALLVGLFALLAVPLARVTSRAGAAPAAELDQQAGPRVACFVMLQTAHPAEVISMHQGGVLLWQGGSPLEQEVDLAGVDLREEVMLKATWPEGTPHTAIRFEFEPEGHPSMTFDFWARDQLEEGVLLHTK